MNLSSYSFEYQFNNDNYNIEDVKTIGIFNPTRWSETFGRPLTRNIKEAKILHTSTGLTLPLKRYSVSQRKQFLEIAGLHSYNEKSKLKQEFIKVNSQKLKDYYLNRIDVCIDFEKVPKYIFEELNKKRKSFQYKNTIYWKTNSERKSNNKLDIKIYNKALKEKLDYPLFRLEFCFKSPYFKNIRLSQLNGTFLLKMEKTIFKFSGVKIKIESL